MFFLLSIFCGSRKVITYKELEDRSPQEVCRNYFDKYVWVKKEDCYTNGTGCVYGKQSEDDVVHACNRVNFYRYLTGVDPVDRTYDETSLNYVRYSSLCLEKNHKLTHLITPEMECYSMDASMGAQWSNIGGGGCSTYQITNFMSDHNVADLGHRRQILNPQLNKCATASTNERASLLVYDYSMKEVKNPPKVIAYPPPGPVPFELVFFEWQFSKEWIKDNNEMPKDAKVTLVCNKENIPVTANVMNPISKTTYPGIVKFRGGRLNPNTNCQVSIVSESLDIEWRYTVKAVNCSAVDLSEKKKKGLSGGAKAAIAIVVILAVAGIGVAVFIIIKKRRNNGDINSSASL